MENADLIEQASRAYAAYMDVVLPGWQEDPNAKDTPRRVAKSFINDLTVGLRNQLAPITQFKNADGYDGIVFQGNIPIKSLCSHHHQNIYGVAHVAYIPSADGKIIGLSKLNRIVEFFSRRPQVQENLTMQIHNKINELIEGNKGVAVVMQAKHMCASHRGVNHDSIMQTAKLSGFFFDNEIGTRAELYNMINQITKPI